MRIQKFSPIDRIFSIFEVLDEKGEVVFDVTKTDDGVLEIGISPSRHGRTWPLVEFEEALEKVRGLALADQGVK